MRSRVVHLRPSLVSATHDELLADNRDSIGVEDHAGGGFVGACQVVEVLAVSIAAGVGHLLILLHAYHQALVTDRLHVVLVTVGRLVEGAL